MQVKFGNSFIINGNLLDQLLLVVPTTPPYMLLTSFNVLLTWPTWAAKLRDSITVPFFQHYHCCPIDIVTIIEK